MHSDNDEFRAPSPFDANVDSVFEEDGSKKSSEWSTRPVKPLQLRSPRAPSLDRVIDTAAPSAFTSTVRDSLGLVQRFFYDSRMQNIQRRQAIKIAQTLFEAEYQSLVQQITLGLDVAKKRIFIEYLRSNKELQKEIQRLAGEAVEDMTGVLMDVRTNAFRNAQVQAKKIEEAYKTGALTREQAAEELEVIATLRDQNLEDSLQTYTIMRENHLTLVARTLELFKEDVIEMKSLPVT